MTTRKRREQRVFTYDEVGDVIHTATRLQHLADEQRGAGAVSWEQLREIADELHISPEALQRAIAASDHDLRAVRRRVRRKVWWVRHAATFLIVALGLIAVDLATGSGVTWAWYPILAWGIFVTGHASLVFGGKGSPLEQRMMSRELRR